jgi:hypothetical protein
MSRYLPFVFLLSTFSLFGIVLTVWDVDPNFAPWYIFMLLVVLVFIAIFGFLGLLLYLVRTRLYRRYSADWYIKTSFKMAFFVALFLGLMATLAVLKLVSTINLALVISAVCLLALWSYLGKKG